MDKNIAFRFGYFSKESFKILTIGRKPRILMNKCKALLDMNMSQNDTLVIVDVVRECYILSKLQIQ